MNNLRDQTTFIASDTDTPTAFSKRKQCHSHGLWVFFVDVLFFFKDSYMQKSFQQHAIICANNFGAIANCSFLDLHCFPQLKKK